MFHLPALRQSASQHKPLLPAVLAVAIRRAIVLIALGATTGVAAQTAGSVETNSAASATARKAYALPAGPLGDVLANFAGKAGVSVQLDARLVEARASAGLQGNHTVREGFALLLAGTGLEVVERGGGIYVLRVGPAGATAPVPGQTATLATVHVTTNGRQENAAGPVQGYVAKRSATATKTDTPILEIPQTINVVTADEIAARGANSITQALRYTAGVNTNGFTDANMIADEITSRGFSPAPLYLDGSYLPYAGSLGGAPQIEPYSLERIEVLKGPASVLYGQNQPGGIINMVTKKPTPERIREAKLGLGSYGRVDGALDLGGSLNDDKTLYYRMLAVANTGDQQIDYTKSSRVFLSPSLTWKPTAVTSLTLYAQYQKDSGVPDYQALPMIGTLVPGPDGKKISRNFFNGEPGYNSFDRRQYVLGADFSHAFNDSVRLRQTVRYVDVNDQWKGYYLLRFAAGPNGPDTSKATRNKLDWRQHNSSVSFDNNLEIKAETGPVRHTLLAGVDYRQFIRRYDGYNNYSADAIDLYNPDYSVIAANPSLTTRWNNKVEQIGVYLQDQIKWDRLVLTLGGRHDWAKIDNKDLLDSAGNARRDDKAFTGRAGLTYLAGNGVAPYVSYSESFLPIIGTDFSGASFKPTTGKQVEAGIKFQPSGSNALVTASVFHIKQKNLTSPDTNPAPEHVGKYVQLGGVESKGVELEGKASLNKNLDVVAALTYTNVTNTSSSYNPDAQLVLSAPWAASVWANYRLLEGALAGLNVGAGARWTGSKYGDAANTFRTPGFVVVDAALRYDLGRIDASLRGSEASLNIQNLFDKTYLSNCNYSFGCYYGKARTVMAGVTYRW